MNVLKRENTKINLKVITIFYNCFIKCNVNFAFNKMKTYIFEEKKNLNCHEIFFRPWVFICNHVHMLCVAKQIKNVIQLFL